MNSNLENTKALLRLLWTLEIAGFKYSVVVMQNLLHRNEGGGATSHLMTELCSYIMKVSATIYIGHRRVMLHVI